MTAPHTVAGHTAGPLHVQQDSQWPFTIRICTQTGETIHSEPLACSSSRWRCLDDARDLIGIHGDERQAWKDAMDRQMADMLLRAAAPDLLIALQAVMREFFPHSWPGEYPELQDARAAIAKATAARSTNDMEGEGR